MLILIIKSIILLSVPISIFFLIKERIRHQNFNKWMDFQEKVIEVEASNIIKSEKRNSKIDEILN
jgi:hypothetical protein